MNVLINYATPQFYRSRVLNTARVQACDASTARTT